MPEFKRFSLLVLITIAAAAANISAQACGGSTNHIYIYVRDGKALINPRYQIISVAPSNFLYDDPKLANIISETFFADGVERRRQFWHMDLFIIKPDLVDKFLKTYKAENYDPAPRWRRLEKENFSGKIEQGHIELPTGEMFGYPYILKIYADNRKPVYVLGAHLGGCDPMERIVIDETDARAYWDRSNN
jgi:hypothetical protein